MIKWKLKPGAQHREEVDTWEAVLAFVPEGCHHDDPDYYNHGDDAQSDYGAQNDDDDCHFDLMDFEVVGSSIRKLIMFNGHLCNLLSLSSNDLDDNDCDDDDEDVDHDLPSS